MYRLFGTIEGVGEMILCRFIVTAGKVLRQIPVAGPSEILSEYPE